jgi:hypothetical protein
MIKVAIIILHFSHKDLTSQCLDSIAKLRTTGFILETIVVNNNPKENLESLKKKFPKIVLLKSQKNLGFAGGNNLGIKKALKDKADFLFILNNDTILDRNLLVSLLETANREKQSGIIAPKIYFAPEHEFHYDRYQPQERGKVIWYAGGLIDWQNIICSHQGVDEVDHGQYDMLSETDFASGCAFFVKKEVFKKIGFFDENYFLYLEDVDFCQRAKKAGFKIFYESKAKLWHINAGSSAVGSQLQDYYLSRNRLIFGLKYAFLKTKFCLIKESLVLLRKGRVWQKTAVRDFYLRKFGQGSWLA